MLRFSLQLDSRIIDRCNDEAPFILLLFVGEMTRVVFGLEAGNAGEGPNLEPFSDLCV